MVHIVKYLISTKPHKSSTVGLFSLLAIPIEVYLHEFLSSQVHTVISAQSNATVFIKTLN